MITRILRYLIIDDYVAKLVCLAIGTGLWFYVEFARVSQTTLNVPIDYVKKPANLYLKSGQPRFTKIVVRGRDEFLKFPTAGIKAEVNLASARPGEAQYPVSFDIRQLPERLEVAQKSETITLSLEKGASRKVPVRIQVTGNPDAALRFQKATATPALVEIEGPEAVIAALAAVDTEPVDIEGATKPLTTKVNLRLPDQALTEKTKTISVRIDFVPKTFSEELSFDQVPLKIQNLDAALDGALSDTVVQVLVQGEASAIKKLKTADIYAYVNAEDTRYNARTGNILPYANESGVQVKARILNGSKKVQIVSVTPDRINIRFSVKPDYIKKSVPAPAPAPEGKNE